MTSTSVQDSIAYWMKTAARDYDTMYGLVRLQRYPEALFFGHIVLEKILKALVVKKTRTQAPYIHDLAHLATLAKVPMTRKLATFFNTVNDFNIRARYPEYKFAFYKLCTKTYTTKYVFEIDRLYKKLCQMLKQNGS